MGKPYLFIVTGRPGAGKTTFAKAFSQAAFLHPVWSVRLEPRLNVPTWRIDTSDGCQPDASQLIKAVWGENKGPF